VGGREELDQVVGEGQVPDQGDEHSEDKPGDADDRQSVAAFDHPIAPMTVQRSHRRWLTETELACICDGVAGCGWLGAWS
jgi:hypothetical protein